MALDLVSVNWPAILVATLLQMVLGAAWFGVFAKPWMREAHPGKTREELGQGSKWPYAVAAVAALVSAYVLAVLLGSTGTTGLMPALLLATVTWLGFTGVPMATTYAFGGRSGNLLSIDAGHHLARFLVAGATLALWP